MTNHGPHCRAALLLILLLVGLAGCVKLRQAVTVMPDGSGKVEMRFGLSPKLIDLAEENEEDPFREVLPGVMADKTRGIAAFTEPKRSVGDDGFTYLAYTMYFRDINRVEVNGFGEDKPTHYRYTKADGGATLTVTQGPAIAKLADYEPTPEEERAQVRDAMAGLVFTERYTLPGAVEPVEGLTTQGNTAELEVTLEHLLEATGPVEKLKGKRELTLTVPELEQDPAALEAFQQELEAAADAWRAKQQAE